MELQFSKLDTNIQWPSNECIDDQNARLHLSLTQFFGKCRTNQKKKKQKHMQKKRIAALRFSRGIQVDGLPRATNYTKAITKQKDRSATIGNFRH